MKESTQTQTLMESLMQPLSQLMFASWASSNNVYNYRKINKKDILLLVAQYTTIYINAKNALRVGFLMRKSNPPPRAFFDS